MFRSESDHCTGIDKVMFDSGPCTTRQGDVVKFLEEIFDAMFAILDADVTSEVQVTQTACNRFFEQRRRGNK